MDEMHSRRLIIPKGILESGNNVIDIPDACEDSRVLIAKLRPNQGSPSRSGQGGGCQPNCPSHLQKLSSAGSISSSRRSVKSRPSRSRQANISISDGIVPAELNNSIINHSLAQLEHVEIEELKVVQEKMRKFQDARRELVISILMLQEAESAGRST